MSNSSEGKEFGGRYRVIQTLGIGGMATVYRVFDEKTRNEIALKVLNNNQLYDEMKRERLRREYSILRKLDLSSVVKAYELHEEAGKEIYFGMEIASGVSLARKIADDTKAGLRRNPEYIRNSLVPVLKEMAKTLHDLHSQKIIYRDLTPSNIILSGESGAETSIKFIDFGISIDLADPDVNMPGGYGRTVVGTDKYMSLEQGKGEILDQRSDIYSLGVVAYEMLTGKAPFDHSSPLALRKMHYTEPVMPPRTLNRSIPKELEKIIMTCLQKDKSRRYREAQDLYERLANFESGGLITQLLKHLFKKSY